MTDGGIRAEIGVGSPAPCPVASATEHTGGTASDVSRSVVPAQERVTEEFTVTNATADLEPGMTPVFESSERQIYRFERSSDIECVCTTIERYDCPVTEARASDGRLYVSFYADDIEVVQSIVQALDERYGDVHVRQLFHAAGSATEDLVFVDRGQLTGRQREVLETALEAGYFEHPKGANASDVANELGIAPSTFAEHLAAAQRKLLQALLGD